MSAELDLTEATAALGRLAMGANYAHDVRLLRLALERLKALSTPPADDVREALAKILTGLDDREWAIATADGHLHLDGYFEAADRILATFRVRPRGTVTEAEPPHTDEYGDCAHPDAVAIGHGEAECPDCMTVGPPAPPADDVREALEADRSVPMPKDQYRVWDRLIEFSQAYRAEHGFPPNEAARTRFLFTAFEVRPHGTVADAEVKPAETYAVYGGQGLRRIASGLSREDAERVSRKFEIDCMNAGLTNPPGRIEREVYP